MIFVLHTSATAVQIHRAGCGCSVAPCHIGDPAWEVLAVPDVDDVTRLAQIAATVRGVEIDQAFCLTASRISRFAFRDHSDRMPIR